MINYRVNNLLAFIESLKNKGIEVIKMEEQPYGLFAHLLDPEDNKIELWEPIPNAFNEIIGARIYDQ
jgi:predicted enzyme related to lactoylglutathione lyase